MTEQTPRGVAEAEAARQAVILAFAVAGTLILIEIQKLTGTGLWALLEGGTDAKTRRMAAAVKSAAAWDRRAAWLFTHCLFDAAKWAHRRAEAAREAYEAERL